MTGVFRRIQAAEHVASCDGKVPLFHRLSGRLLAIVWAITLSVGSLPASADLFDGLQALRDTLRAWEASPPQAVPPSGEGESLEAWFPGARIEPVGERVRIALPPLYQELFPATLWADSSFGAWVFSVGLEVQDSLVVLDGVLAEGLPAGVEWAALRHYVRQTLTALRTLAVPAPTPVREDPEGVVEVKLVGREIEVFTYDTAVWQRVLRRLAQGMTVHAFLLKAEVGETAAALTWAVFLRAPGLPGHHFLQFQERLELSSSREPGPRELAVRFVAGVRMDNVEELFAPAGSDLPLEWRLPLYLPRR